MMKAWWFEPDDGKLGYGDRRKPEKGVTHTVECEPVLCKAGLHGSIRLLDALSYAESNIVWRVKLDGKIVNGDDKCAATERTYLERYEIEGVLREFARWCALQVVDKWDAPDVVRRYLETGNESIRSAALDAAAAARDAAWSAAAAARDAAWSAALDAARDAARDAAWAVAWSVAWSAAGDEYNAKLESMVLEVA